MPAVSQEQQQFGGAEHARCKRGEKTRSGISCEEAEKLASTKRKGLPVRKRPTGSGTFTDDEIEHGFRKL